MRSIRWRVDTEQRKRTALLRFSFFYTKHNRDRLRFDSPVKSMIISHSRRSMLFFIPSVVDAHCELLQNYRMNPPSSAALALSLCSHPGSVHKATRRARLQTNSKLSIFIWSEMGDLEWLKAAARYENKHGRLLRQRKSFDRASSSPWMRLIKNEWADHWKRNK